MADKKGQMLLLAGVLLVSMFIMAAVISSNLSNIKIQTSLEQSHPLFLEFEMVKDQFIDALDKKGVGEFDSINQRISSIESEYDIYINAELNGNTLSLYLQDDDTKLSGDFQLN